MVLKIRKFHVSTLLLENIDDCLTNPTSVETLLPFRCQNTIRLAESGISENLTRSRSAYEVLGILVPLQHLTEVRRGVSYGLLVVRPLLIVSIVPNLIPIEPTNLA